MAPHGELNSKFFGRLWTPNSSGINTMDNSVRKTRPSPDVFISSLPAFIVSSMMVRSHIAYLTASLLSLPLLSEGYQWPDPIDAIEELYAVTDGLGASNVVFPITPCGFSPLSTSGRQAAAEWIRT